MLKYFTQCSTESWVPNHIFSRHHILLIMPESLLRLKKQGESNRKTNVTMDPLDN